MNPFAIGQYLFVQFGTRQRWQVAALSNTRCALRMASTVTPATLWFTVDDLLRWNPQTEPQQQPRKEPRQAELAQYFFWNLPMEGVTLQPRLPAPRHIEFERQRVQMQRLAVGDILLHGPLLQTVMVCALGQVYNTHPLPNAPHFREDIRFGVLQDLKTGRKWEHEFRNAGHGGERVIGRAG